VREEPSPEEQRDDTLRGMLARFINAEDGFGLDAVWIHGQEAAAELWISKARKDRRPVQVLFDEISDRINLAIDHANELMEEDPDYDDADELERDAMSAAMGASISAYAFGADEADAKARAAEAFAIARAATTRALDLDINLEAKIIVLEHAMKSTGLAWDPGPKKQGFEAARFHEGFERAAAEALRMQRNIDESGGYFVPHDLTNRLDKLARDPAAERFAQKTRRRWDRFAQATHEIRAFYERALAEEGSEVAAAARTLEEAARLVPEARR
jgi:hypothetical protein